MAVRHYEMKQTAMIVVDPEPQDYAPLLRWRDCDGGAPLWFFLGSGRPALRCLPMLVRLQVPVSLCLVNTQLADMSGCDLLPMLRPHMPGGRAVLVGNVYDANDEMKARRRAAAVYVCKPVSASVLEQVNASNIAVSSLAPEPLPKPR